MKLVYIFIGIIVLTLAGGSFYYTNIKKDDNTFKVASSTPPVTSVIYLYKEFGDISYKNKADSAYTDLKDTKVAISNYTSVKTGIGRGYVIFPDNSSITLSTSTEIEISYEPTKVSIMQLLGTTYHRVTALATGNKYEIRTPNTLAAIRGTKLAVSYNLKNKKTFVAVTEHSVEVTPTKNDGTASNAPVMVQEGSLADIQSPTTTPKNSSSTPVSSGKMTIKTNDDVKELKPFLEENRIIDKQFDKTSPENKRELLEKIINSLQKEDSSKSSQSDTTNNPPKTESRLEVLNRVVQQLSPTTQTTKTPTVTKEQELAPVTPKTTTPVTTEPNPVTQETKTLKELPTNVEEFTPEQEAFIDTFYATYEKYFFVDEPGAYCRKVSSLTSKDMFTYLITVSNKAGYTLPKQSELTSFANDLISACKEGTMTDKAASFKTRFDITYPY